MPESVASSEMTSNVYVRLSLGTTAKSEVGIEIRVSSDATEGEIEATIEKASDAFYSLRRAYDRLEHTE